MDVLRRSVNTITFFAVMVYAMSGALPFLMGGADRAIMMGIVMDRRILAPLVALVLIGVSFVLRRTLVRSLRSRVLPDRGFATTLAAAAMVSTLTFAFIESPFLGLATVCYLASTVLLLAISTTVPVVLATIITGAAHSAFSITRAHVSLAVVSMFVCALVIVCTLSIRRLVTFILKQEDELQTAKLMTLEYLQVNARMQKQIERTESGARISERRRLAREVHDTVGYALTAILVQIAAVRDLMRIELMQADARLSQIERMVRSAIEDVRQEVRDIRDTSAVENWRDRWERLCVHFAETTGVGVNFNTQSPLPSLSDDIGENIYRVLQEALTNAYRHGRCSYVDISMSEIDHQLVCRISDDGAGLLQLQKGSGVTGIEERIAYLGGRVAFQFEPGRGFDIGIVLPLTGGELS